MSYIRFIENRGTSNSPVQLDFTRNEQVNLAGERTEAEADKPNMGRRVRIPHQKGASLRRMTQTGDDLR
jgi:hypothetical protein